MQELSGVKDWNFWLSACASLPFCALKSDPDPEADELAAALGVGAGDVLAADAAEDEVAWVEEFDTEEEAVLFPALLPPMTPGDWTRSSSCCPAGTGPEGFAGQLPGGFTAAFWPNGIVPAAPGLRLPTNKLGFVPWNWHWKIPLSSAFRGACWQYGTLRELGWN